MSQKFITSATGDAERIGRFLDGRCPVCRRSTLVLGNGGFGVSVRCRHGCSPIAIARSIARRRPDGAP
jgi:hypothetical protein